MAARRPRQVDPALERLRAGIEAAVVRIGNGWLAHPGPDGPGERLRSGEVSAQACLEALVAEVYGHVAGHLTGLPSAADWFDEARSRRAAWVRGGTEERAAALRALDAVLDAAVDAGLPPDALGVVHEALLDRVPTLDAATGAFALLPGRETARRSTGSYYTPPALVDYVLDCALDPVLDHAAQAEDPEAAILGLRVVDPACGSGRFLVGAARRMGHRLARVRAGGEDPAPETVRQAVAEVVARALYGVDVVPVAVGICRLALWLEAVGPTRGTENGAEGGPAPLPQRLPPETLRHALSGHVRHGDALLGASPDLLAAGIPAAAWERAAGDDAGIGKVLRARNARDRAAFAAGEALAKGNPCGGGTGDNAPVDANLLADLWCAAFVWPRAPGTPAEVADAAPTAGAWEAWGRGGALPPPATVRTARELAGRHGFLHWHLAFPEVFARGGFDVVVGNPPFLNQLERGVAQERSVRRLVRGIYGTAVLATTDVATLFLLRAQGILRTGGRQALVQPLSLVGSEGAGPTRAALAATGTLTDAWMTAEHIFPEALVHVCVFTLAKRTEGAHVVRRARARAFAVAPSLTCARAALSDAGTWGALVVDLVGVPPVVVREERRLRERATTTADFRDQFFGLAPFVQERFDGDVDEDAFPRLVVTGLVDPARCLWGVRPCRFAKRTYLRPRVDLAALVAQGALAGWARGRLRPKIVVATQSRVLEAFADEGGTLINTVPTITVYPHDPGDLWHLLAVLLAPPVSAWALRRWFGNALSVHALKLSASQVGELPLPTVSAAWDAAAEQVRAASATTEAPARRALLEAAGARMCEAYEVPAHRVMDWWRARLPRDEASGKNAPGP